MFVLIKKLKEAVVLFTTKPTGRSFSFDNEDWDFLDDIVELLRPIYNATVEISSEKYVSGSKVIPLVKGLFNLYHKKEAEYVDIHHDSFKSR